MQLFSNWLSILVATIFSASAFAVDCVPKNMTDRQDLARVLWKSPAYGYDLIFSIDKGDSRAPNAKPTAQRLRVISFTENPEGVLVFETKVSTGAELPGFTKQEIGKDNKGNPIFKTTPRTTPMGLYDVNELTPQAYSQSRKVWLYYDIWFGSPELAWQEYAIHQVPGGYEGKLGKRDSGGCIRTPVEVAPVLYKMAENVGIGPVLKINHTMRSPMIFEDGVRLSCQRRLLIEIYNSSEGESSLFTHVARAENSFEEIKALVDQGWPRYEGQPLRTDQKPAEMPSLY